MEIDNNRIATLATHTSGQGAPVDKQPSGDHGKPETATGGSGDAVSLTGEARRLKQLEADLASRPAVDSQRVDQVRSAVENGTFTIDPQRIAEKIISLEQALTEAR